MKYLKTYEENKSLQIYYPGDYLLLDVERIKNDNIELRNKYGDDFSDPTDNLSQMVKYDKSDDYPYIVKLYNGDEQCLDNKEIIRKMTSEEIEEYKLKKTAFKYNL